MKSEPLENVLFFSKTSDFLNRYLPEQASKSARTVETYRDALTVFRRYLLEEKKISIRAFKFTDCTHDLLLEYLEYLKDSGHKESTCNNRMAAIKSYLWYAADRDVALQSVALAASRIPRLREPKVKRDIITEEDLSALLRAPGNGRIGMRDRMIMILLYDSAIRVSELLGLTISSLCLTASPSYIHVHGKGDKERIVVLSDKTVEHLGEYLKVYHPDPDKDDLLFYTVVRGQRGRMSVGNVERLINKYADMIRPEHPNLPEHVHPHMFRRTRATDLYQDGVELELVSRILGHSSTETTRIYATPSLEMLKEAMDNGRDPSSDEKPLWLDDEDELAALCGIR